MLHAPVPLVQAAGSKQKDVGWMRREGGGGSLHCQIAGPLFQRIARLQVFKSKLGAAACGTTLEILSLRPVQGQKQVLVNFGGMPDRQANSLSEMWAP